MNDQARTSRYEEALRKPAALLQHSTTLESHNYGDSSLNFTSNLFSITDVINNERLYGANIFINNYSIAYLDGDEFRLLKQAVTIYQGSNQSMIYSCRSIRMIFDFYGNQNDHIVLFGNYSIPYDPTSDNKVLISFTSANLLAYLDKFIAKMV